MLTFANFYRPGLGFKSFIFREVFSKMNPIYVFLFLSFWAEDSTEEVLFYEERQIGARTEICDNNIDDDEDGLIDVFDPDCQCPGLNPPNLVPNGQFSETNGCCANLGEVNCLVGWEVLGPSPDYISDNCLQSNLRPDVRFLSNALNTSFNDGYIFGLVHQVDGRHFTESIGVCLDSTLLAGQTYKLSFDIANLRNDDPDILFSIMGIPDCNRLTSYNTTSRDIFCDIGLPFERLATLNAQTLNSGWNTYELEFTPSSDIEAIFYSSDCDSQPGTRDANFYMVLDNVSIREVIEELPTIEISSRGGACEDNFSLSTNSHPNYTYQWYKDSLQVAGATDSIFIFEGGTESRSGTYHVLVADEEGNCQLSTPYQHEVPLVVEEIEVTICEGESYPFAGRDLEEAGSYQDTLMTVSGCDSIVNLRLELLASSFLSYADTICPNDSLSFGDQLLTQTGIYRDTLIAVNGCDSIIELDLLVHPMMETQLSQRICEGEVFPFGGQMLSTAGIYWDTLSTSFGCDSLIQLVLEVLSIPSLSYTEAICANDTLIFGDQVLSQAGIYSDTLTTETGCDSIIELNLLVHPMVETQELQTICEGETFPFGGRTLSTSGIYRDTLSTSFGCDSLVQLTLEVLSSISLSYSEMICAHDSFLFSDQVLRQPGIYRDTLMATNGCDSIIELDLLVHPAIETQVSQTICEGEFFSFGGELLGISGIYRDTLDSAVNCDSVVVLQLAVQETIVGDTLRVEQWQGTTYDFHGEIIEDSGSYETRLATVAGCDSIVHLVINFIDPCANGMSLEIEQSPPTCELASNGGLEVFVQGGTPPFRYAIDGGENYSEDPLFENLSIGTYDVVVMDAFDCRAEMELVLGVTTVDLEVKLGADTVILEGQSLLLAIEAVNFMPVEYSWTSTGVLNCTSCRELRIRPDTSALYTLFVSDENGCTVTDQIYIEVTRLPMLYIPNVFSPNLDGINDFFQAAGPEKALDSIEEMKIFSRWGDLIFQQKKEAGQSPLSWDGRFRGKEAERGVYLYMISRSIGAGQIEILTGDVLLIR